MSAIVLEVALVGAIVCAFRRPTAELKPGTLRNRIGIGTGKQGLAE